MCVIVQVGPCLDMCMIFYRPGLVFVCVSVCVHACAFEYVRVCCRRRLFMFACECFLRECIYEHTCVSFYDW